MLQEKLQQASIAKARARRAEHAKRQHRRRKEENRRYLEEKRRRVEEREYERRQPALRRQQLQQKLRLKRQYMGDAPSYVRRLDEQYQLQKLRQFERELAEAGPSSVQTLQQFELEQFQEEKEKSTIETALARLGLLCFCFNAVGLVWRNPDAGRYKLH